MRAWPIRSRRRTLLNGVFTLALIGILVSLFVPSASAAPSCTVSSGTLTIAWDTPATIDVSRDPSGIISVGGLSCGGPPTVSTTNSINVTGDASAQNVIIRLDNGGYGAINWVINVGGGAGQVLEIDAASAGSRVVAGANGIDLNDDGNLDVTASGFALVRLIGGAGNDSLSAGGGSATGGSIPTAVLVSGGAGDDAIAGGSGDDSLAGDAGNDSVSFANASSAVTVDLSAGTATGQGLDILSGIENVDGSSSNDTITGDAAANDLFGDSGNDVMNGSGGDDRLDGGTGSDALDGGDGTDFCVNTDGDARQNCELPAPPVVTQISPDHGSAGGGTPVTITGTGFVGVTDVRFGAVRATFNVTSATQIQTTSPHGPTGAVDVMVATATATSARGSADLFTYGPPFPAVSGVDPTSGETSGGTSVTIVGTAFSGATTVSFGGVSVTPTTVADTRITVTSPQHQAGPFHVTVTTAAGTSTTSSADLFTFTPPNAPVVDAIDPTSGPTSGNTVVTITGTGFTGATQVAFGAVSVTPDTVTETIVTATSPPEPAAPVDIMVTSQVGTSATTPADVFTFTKKNGPVVSRITPTQSPTDGHTPVVIVGTGLRGATHIFFGRVEQPIYRVVSDTQIQTTSPPQPVGVVHVTVTTPLGTSATTSSDLFTYGRPLPAISAIDPRNGFTTGGTLVTITGSSFTGATQVTFGDVSVRPTSETDTEIIVTSPPLPAGLVDVRVTTPAGTSVAGSNDQFTFVPNGPVVDGTSGRVYGNSLRTPAQLPGQVKTILFYVALAVLLVLFIPFPAELFNDTLKEHQQEIAAWFQRLRARILGRRLVAGVPHGVAFILAILVAALMYGFLDPEFGFNRSGGITYLGFVVGLLLTTIALGVSDLVFMRRHPNSGGSLRAYGWGLPVAALCVVVSRAAAFQPGYLYGVVAGFVFSTQIDDQEDGRKTAVLSVWTIIVSIAAWLIYVPVQAAVSRGNASFGIQVLDIVLITVFVAGVESLAFGLLPVRSFPGRNLFGWNRWIWAVLYGFGVLGFLYVLASPQTGYQSKAPLLTTIALFAGFGIASIGFAYLFRRRTVRKA